MMSQANELRAKVDALRAAAGADVAVLAQLDQDMAGLLESRGLYDVREPEADSHSIHMCPWHTCQATRHHEIRIQ